MKAHKILQNFITGLGKGYANSLIVVSKAGLGKTETTIRTLHQMGFEENKHYRYISNYVTPVELYNLLQEINDLKEPRLLVLDDIEEVLRNVRSIGILKSALWETPNGKRKVCWLSGTYRVDTKEFDFKGRIIFLLNELKRENVLIQALKDRGFYYEFDLNPSEKLELIKIRAEVPYHDIPISKRREIVDFLVKNGNGSDSLTLRILPKAYNLYLISPNHYQTLLHFFFVF